MIIKYLECFNFEKCCRQALTVRESLGCSSVDAAISAAGKSLRNDTDTCVDVIIM